MYLPANVEDNTIAGYNDAKTGIAGFLIASGFEAKGGDAAAIAKSVVGGMVGIL